MFCNKGVLKNFGKFKGKHLCLSLFFNNVADLRHQASNFIEKETGTGVFLCILQKKFKSTFGIEHLWWQLLYFFNEFLEELKVFYLDKILDISELINLILL